MAAQGLTVSHERSNWRFCAKCHVIFYANAPDNVCAAGGRHDQQASIEYRLPWGVPDSPTAQPGWRCCRYCQAMYFDGYPSKGKCPATQRGHAPDTSFHYVLPHDVPASPTKQPGWRFCNKCFAMFYDADPNKGRCAAGEGHVAQGFNFVMPHPR